MCRRSRVSIAPTIDRLDLLTIEILDDRRNLGILIHGECEVVDDGDLIRSSTDGRSVSRTESMGTEGHLPVAYRLQLMFGRIMKLEAVDGVASRLDPRFLAPYPDRRQED